MKYNYSNFLAESQPANYFSFLLKPLTINNLIFKQDPINHEQPSLLLLNNHDRIDCASR
jgi:hypothetical protein